MGDMKFLSERALRDYAYNVLKNEYGDKTINGIIHKGTMTDEEIAEFAKQMKRWQLEQLYLMINNSEFKGAINDI